MRDLERFRNAGMSYDSFKDAVVNGSATNVSPSRDTGTYQRLIGKKGNLEQRLKTIVAYKRSTIAGESLSSGGDSILSVSEEEELETMMESQGKCSPLQVTRLTTHLCRWR